MAVVVVVCLCGCVCSCLVGHAWVRRVKAKRLHHTSYPPPQPHCLSPTIYQFVRAVVKGALLLVLHPLLNMRACARVLWTFVAVCAAVIVAAAAVTGRGGGSETGVGACVLHCFFFSKRRDNKVNMCFSCFYIFRCQELPPDEAADLLQLVRVLGMCWLRFLGMRSGYMYM